MLVYVYLAAGSLLLGVVLSFIVVFTCVYLSIDIFENLWVLVIPVTLAVSLNILFVELYHRYKKK
jgi:hypothetical protein